jgi:SulP family sulfate permease
MKHREKSILNRFVPVTDWIQGYDYPDFQNDLRAGLTVGVILIPQSMAYALLAGLPPTYGLYASVVPLIIYAVFGTSRQLSIGPVAIISILIATGVSGVAEQGTEQYIAIVLGIALMVGATQFLMGLSRLGFLMNFLSNPVLSGFTSAAAFIIGFSQAGNLLGIDLEGSKYVIVVIADIYQNIGQIHLPTFALGLGSLVFILIIQKIYPKLPVHLIAVVLSTFTVWLFDLHQMGIGITGEVGSGFPMPSLPSLFDVPYWNVLPTVLAVAFLGFTQSVALAKAMTGPETDYKVDSNQELFSLGLANMIGSVFNAYPVAGSFSRTAVNSENDAKSPISLLVSALLVLLMLLFFTSFIYYLPNAVLAAIIITAVPGLIELGEVRFLLQVRKRELALMMITFFATLLLGILEGIGVGVLISLVIMIHRSTYPNIVMLGRIPETDTYRDLNRYPEALTQTNTIIVRVDAALYFANIPYFKEQLEKLELESGKKLNQIIIDAIGINEVDASAVRGIKDLVSSYKERDINVIFTGVKGPVRDMFKRSGLDDTIGPERFYVDINEAVESLTDEKEEESHLV